MKIFKQATLLTALLTSLIFLTSTNQAHANMFNKFREGFYFEKYNPAYFKISPKVGDKNRAISEARTALLELHPTGSSYENLFKTLDKAGAKVEYSIKRADLSLDPAREKEYFSGDISKSASTMYRYRYDTGIWLINPITWIVLVFCDDNNLITDIYLSRDYSGL